MAAYGVAPQGVSMCPKLLTVLYHTCIKHNIYTTSINYRNPRGMVCLNYASLCSHVVDTGIYFMYGY